MYLNYLMNLSNRVRAFMFADFTFPDAAYYVK